jgi:hypothetical protein
MTKTTLIMVCLLWILPISASYALRCGSDLITEDDTQSQVRRSCGDPTEVADWVEHRLVRVYYSYSPIFEEIVKPIYIEEWIYNFGPQRFMRKLRFENGNLQNIKTLGYGY